MFKRDILYRDFIESAETFSGVRQDNGSKRREDCGYGKKRQLFGGSYYEPGTGHEG